MALMPPRPRELKCQMCSCEGRVECWDNLQQTSDSVSISLVRVTCRCANHDCK